jgi:hypothetical protein
LPTLDLNQLHRTRARLPLLRDERTALVQPELSKDIAKIDQDRWSRYAPRKARKATRPTDCF